jgi:hypothetical protein
MRLHRSRSLACIAVFALAISLTSCAARPVHPGAANSFDSAAYDSLLVTHSIIESTKTDLATSETFPASIVGNVRTALSYLIDSYNIAQKAYVTYHAAALLGKATPEQATAVQNGLTDTSLKTQALTAAKNGAKP